MNNKAKQTKLPHNYNLLHNTVQVRKLKLKILSMKTLANINEKMRSVACWHCNFLSATLFQNEHTFW